MTAEWPLVRLEDLASIKHGFAFKGEFFSEEPTENFLVTPGNFAVGGGFKLDKVKYYDGPVPDEYKLRSGDLIVTMTDLSKKGDTLGYSGLVPYDPRYQFLHNQRIGLVCIHSECLDKYFLYFLMRTDEYRNHVLGSATGSTVKHTSPSKIAAYEFRLPPLSIQRQIGETLMSLERKIELNQDVNKTLEQIAQALFKSWFVDFEPVKAKVAALESSGTAEDAERVAMQTISGKSAAELEALRTQNPDQYNNLARTAALFPSAMVESEHGEIPEGWRISKIGSEVDVVGGGTPPTKNPEFWEGGTVNWTSPKDLAGSRDKVLIDTERKITEAGLKKISSGFLPENTVLMSSRAPVGYLALARIELAVNQGYIAMKCFREVSPEFVVQWCAANMEDIKNRASGTTFSEISKKNFKIIPIVVPDIGLLDAYTAQVRPIYQQVEALIKQSDSLSQLRDTLLPKLLSGELTIPEAEEKTLEPVGV